MYKFKKDYREVTESTEPQNSLEINGREEGVKIDCRLLFLIIILVVS